jgi:hypothetical protein
MTTKMPPIPPANQSNKGPVQKSDEKDQSIHDTARNKDVNPNEQGATANIKQNTTNEGFFRGRRVK